jgi:hypothetical protein
MRYDENAPATRKDVQLLINHIGSLYLANRQWKEEIVQEVKASAQALRRDLPGAVHQKTDPDDGPQWQPRQALGPRPA